MSDVQTTIRIAPEVSGADTAASEIGKIYEELRKGTKTVEEANNEMKAYSDTIYSQRRAIMLIRTEWRNQNAALLEGMRGMMSVARLGRNLTNIFQTHTMMQIRVAGSTRDIADTEEELQRVRTRRIQSQSELGAGNVYALGLMEEERRLANRLIEGRRDLRAAQNQNALGYVAIALAAVDVIPNLVDIWSHMKNLEGIMGSAWALTALTSLTTKLGTVKTAAGSLLGKLLEIGGWKAPKVATDTVLDVLDTVTDISTGGTGTDALDVVSEFGDKAAAALGLGTTAGAVITGVGLGVATVGGLIAIESQLPGGELTAMSGADMTPFGVTRDELQAGIRPEDKFLEWRNQQLYPETAPVVTSDVEMARQGITINQINNISADDQNTMDKILDSITNMLYQDPEWVTQ